MTTPSSLTVIALIAACVAACAAPVSIFVSPDGDDRWSGRRDAPDAGGNDGPVATLERARDLARQHRGETGVQVLVRDGVYTLARPLTFRPGDSGTEGAPVIFRAYPGERPVISGGRAITGWREGDRRLWIADVPKGWYFTRLFVNGAQAIRSREPDTDNWGRWFLATGGGPADPDAPEGIGSRVFMFPPGTLRAWRNLGDVEINSLPSYRYANIITPLASVDEATSTATLTSQAYYNYAPGDPFRVENTLEGLDRPGEWCLDSVAGTVTYWPREGEDMTTASVVAPALTRLVEFIGDEATGQWVHDISLQGFTFTHCDRRRWNESPSEDEANLHILDSCVYLEGTERCAIEDCRFVNVAGFGARFNLTARNNRFVGNEVVGAGCGGLQAGGYGPGTKDVNHGHTITHNHIHHSSTDFWHAGAIDLRQSGGNYIAWNLIHHMPYTGICISGAHTAYFRQYNRRGEGVGRAKYNFRWDEIPADNPLTPEGVKPFLHGRNNIVEHNVLYELLGRLPADGGALYGFGQGLGNVFRNNLVYRAHCLAIYLDAEFDGVLVEGNTVYDSASPFGGSGAYPTLRDNALYPAGQVPTEVRRLGEQMTRLAEQATGPYWHRTVSEIDEGAVPMRDPAKREFAASFTGFAPDEEIPGQGPWRVFGPGSYPAAISVPASGLYDPGMVALADGIDSWAAAWHGLVLDPARDIVLQMDAALPDPLEANSFFELYLNQGQIHANEAFGVGLVGGKEDGVEAATGARMDAAGPRVLTTERLTPGRWYRVRLVIPAGSQTVTAYIMDLTAGDTEFRAVSFADGETAADITRGDGWKPPLDSLDAIVLRLGGGAQATNILLQN
ncbi:MAG: right-handed parallel beta-helix repeat-containing protein [Acidobacteriota bacterium]|nr:right-handed parallel beta-helix repeat-containing protein [Acidobacteriota bacterium]